MTLAAWLGRAAITVMINSSMVVNRMPAQAENRWTEAQDRRYSLPMWAACRTNGWLPPLRMAAGRCVDTPPGFII